MVLVRMTVIMVLCGVKAAFCSQTSEQFLNSLIAQKSSEAHNQQTSQEQQEDEQNTQEQRDLQGLTFIEKYYGNPQYQKAIEILHDAALQSQYEDSLNNMQLFFFEYTNQVLGAYHVPKTTAEKSKSEDNSVTVTSFLDSMKAKGSSSHEEPLLLPSPKVASSTLPVNSSASDSTTSFLDSLKG